MRNLCVLCVIIMVTTACQNREYKSIENLKSSADGEKTASVMYAKFADVAISDSMFRVAAMFRAMSASEEIHARNHLNVLREMDIIYEPVLSQFTIGSTLENIKTAKKMEMYEMLDKRYPDFIKIAAEENLESALKSFKEASMIETKHNLFCYKAISEIEFYNGSDLTVNGQWMVCKTCGNTFIKNEVDKVCEICQSSSETFIDFSIE